MNATVDLVTSAAVVRNATTVSEISPACIDLILNIVLSAASLLVFIGTVIITYFVDDPGLRKLKRGTQQSESVDITESDKNYIRYLAERKFQNQIKGHTFSAFSPAYNLSLTTGTEPPELRRTVPYARRRACSESHTAHRMSDASSETQIVFSKPVADVVAKSEEFHLPSLDSIDFILLFRDAIHKGSRPLVSDNFEVLSEEMVSDGVSVSVTRRLENGYLVVLQAPQSGKTSSIIEYDGSVMCYACRNTVYRDECCSPCLLQDGANREVDST
ncbi:hypothetical protein T265_11073 [Opisthorchis viverrini]|uniref:Uncharacterized protein n=1 Tax=Opisthorchis viverrini TaxID=6198 RepID=A0A074ZAT9_OPIVI|nr:hypothetical protein T265_11073 [Opisthorchis viverrini]KER20355.1 hypothetical protein T265_11073 [Opisthorchis viverrini]